MILLTANISQQIVPEHAPWCTPRKAVQFPFEATALWGFAQVFLKLPRPSGTHPTGTTWKTINQLLSWTSNYPKKKEKRRITYPPNKKPQHPPPKKTTNTKQIERKNDLHRIQTPRFSQAFRPTASPGVPASSRQQRRHATGSVCLLARDLDRARGFAHDSNPGMVDVREKGEALNSSAFGVSHLSQNRCLFLEGETNRKPVT